MTKTIENYDDGDPTTGAADKDRTVEFTYTADGRQATITARQQSASDDQTTTYVYGTTLSDSDVARSDLLRAEIYPDSDDVASPLGDGADSTYDRIEYKYNRQGQRTEMKDQNGSVHAYDYDKLGRQTQGRVTTLGSGVDGAVRRLASTYEVRGGLEKATSYDNATVGSGSVVNEVQLEYNDFSQVSTEYQAHGGAVNTSTSPKVQYSYANGSANHVRREKVTYPNGRVLHYGYDSGDDANLSRLSFLADDSSGSPGTHLAEYTYLGRGGIVQVDCTEPDLRYDLAHGSGDDPYDGLDRFDRVVDLLWYDYGTSADAARIKHGYDRAGNRLWREDPVADANSVDLDELYSYDGLYQLKDMQRGDLNANKDGLVASTKTFAEDWTLDPLGNWTTYKQDTDGDNTWDLDQSRSHNKANEISDIDSSSTHVAHDRNGNMTKVPKPDDWNAHLDLTYDGWNRLVKVEDGANTVAEYAYDPSNRRTLKKVYSGGSLDHTRHFYYTTNWQVLEERIDSASSADRQFVWGQRYIDDLILRDRDADEDTQTGDLGKTGSGLEERLYAMQDPNWNVIAIADNAGDVQERYAYDAYGNCTIKTAAFGARASTSFDWETRYAGYRWDAESALCHVRLRYLSGRMGRWLSRDPIAYRAATFNLHCYVQNSGLNALDALGLAEFFAKCDDCHRTAEGHPKALREVMEDAEGLDASRFASKCRVTICYYSCVCPDGRIFPDVPTWRPRDKNDGDRVSAINWCNAIWPKNKVRTFGMQYCKDKKNGDDGDNGGNGDVPNPPPPAGPGGGGGQPPVVPPPVRPPLPFPRPAAPVPVGAQPPAPPKAIPRPRPNAPAGPWQNPKQPLRPNPGQPGRRHETPTSPEETPFERALKRATERLFQRIWIGPPIFLFPREMFEQQPPTIA